MSKVRCTAQFTGGDTLTGFAKEVSNLLFLNEVSKSSAKAYSLSHAETKSSGFSFGAVQWDLVQRPEIRGGFFATILENAVDGSNHRILTDKQIETILNKVQLRGKPDALNVPVQGMPGTTLKDLVNLALCSDFGLKTINEQHVIEINALVSRVNATITAVGNQNDRNFLQRSLAAQLFIADVNNNFGTEVRNALTQFVQGQEVLPQSGGVFVQKRGDKLGLDDLLAFYFSTGRAQTPDGLNDELRRFANVVDVATNGGKYVAPNDPTFEEAKGLWSLYLEHVINEKGTLSNFKQIEANLFLPAANAVINAQGRDAQGQLLAENIQNLILNPRFESPLQGTGDPLQGTDQSDLVLGASGSDVLIGGQGDDVLRGGAGKDLYVYNSGDGHDVIVDNPTDALASGDSGDGLGTIVYDEHALGGGIHHTTDASNTYTSLDGQYTYVQTGNDLIVNGNLTIKDFTNGDLGITLTNAPDIATNFDNGGQTRTVFQKVDHYVQVGTDPDGNAILEPVFAPFFDDNGNNTQSGTPQLGGLTPPLGDNNNLIHAGGGSDFIASGAGDDQLFGDAGADTIFAGGGNDRVSGGTENDFLNGGAGDDFLAGDDPNDPRVVGGNDKLYGDAGNDQLIGNGGNDELRSELKDEHLLCAV